MSSTNNSTGLAQKTQNADMDMRKVQYCANTHTIFHLVQDAGLWQKQLVAADSIRYQRSLPEPSGYRSCMPRLSHFGADL